MFRSTYFRLLLLMSSTILVLLAILGATTYYEIRNHMQAFGEASLRGEVSEPKFAVDALSRRRDMEEKHNNDANADESRKEAAAARSKKKDASGRSESAGSGASESGAGAANAGAAGAGSGGAGGNGHSGSVTGGGNGTGVGGITAPTVSGNESLSEASSDTQPEILSLADDSGQDVYFVAVSNKKQVVLHTSEMPVSAAALESEVNPSGFTVLRYQLRPFRVYAFPYKQEGFNGTIYIYQMITGEVRTLKDIAAILWTIGGVGGFLVVLLNFWLARRALHPARETWRAQQEMLLELSHELRTPLATISTIASGDVSAGKAGLGPGIGRRLVRETEHATALINDILYFAQLRSALDQKVEPVAVSDVTEDTVVRFQPLAEARGMVLRGQSESAVYVTCTIERWTHLVSILLKNATQHGREGTEIRWNLTSTRDAVKFVVENEVEGSPAPSTMRTERATSEAGRGTSGAGERLPEAGVGRGEVAEAAEGTGSGGNAKSEADGDGARASGFGGHGDAVGAGRRNRHDEPDKMRLGSIGRMRAKRKPMGTQLNMNITGIGLRIAYRLVKDMRGRMTQTRLQDKIITEVIVPRVSRWSV